MSEKILRKGFTTGSCAAAAAKAAAFMLLSGGVKETIRIQTPKGVPFDAQIEEITRGKDFVKCAVRKDGGDDPDITHGSLVFAMVWISEAEDALADKHRKCSTQCTDIGIEQEDFSQTAIEKPEEKGNDAGIIGESPITGKHSQILLKGLQDDAPAQIIIDGGIGVGRVTKPGLDQPVGNAAINHVPREMITREVTEVCNLFDYHGFVKVEISIPDGVRLAEKTFNPRFGIVGGISVIGTSGIVEPMSTQALLDTIEWEMKQQKALGMDPVVVSPGNYGQDFLKSAYNYDLDKSVKCSNFIGLTIDMAKRLGFRTMLLVGHVGKLIKVSGGIMNTHSAEGDCRMELLAAWALRSGADADCAREILACVSTEEAVRILDAHAVLPEAMQLAMAHLQENIQRRAGDELRMECMMYTKEYGLLAATQGAEAILRGKAQWGVNVGTIVGKVPWAEEMNNAGGAPDSRK